MQALGVSEEGADQVGAFWDVRRVTVSLDFLICSVHPILACQAGYLRQHVDRFAPFVPVDENGEGVADSGPPG
jgi:hypothetical protein